MIFGLFKGILEANRDTLYQAKQRTDSGDVGYGDLGYLMYGGEVPLADGSVVLLQNAIEEGLRPSHLRSAREKCGYCPATRAALKSNQIRHELIETTSGSVDKEVDPLGALLGALERDNEAALQALVNNGYEHATKGKRKVVRVTANQVEGRVANETVPGSRARQDLLADCSTAGQFFQMTNGGDMANCTDALIGKTRKEMKKKAIPMQKRKNAWEDWKASEAAGNEIVNRMGPRYQDWLKPQLRKILEWMVGPSPADEDKLPPANASKAVHVQIYKDKYQQKFEAGEFPCGNWTADDEERLDQYINGDISSLDESDLLKEAFEREAESLTTRLNLLPRTTIKTILAAVDLEILREAVGDTNNHNGGAASNDAAYDSGSESDEYDN